MTDAIASTIKGILAEHEAMKHAWQQVDADAWIGAVEHRDSLLDDLSALYRQRDSISTGLAPAL